MRTLGLDLAAQPAKTGACIIEWDDAGAQIVELEVGWDDSAIRKSLGSCDKCGIDVPLGWPAEFVRGVGLHAEGQWPDGETSMRRLTHRATDEYVRGQVRKVPLSVSTDKIGVPALRAAVLLSKCPVDRTGAGRIVEVYPAAALCRWGFDPLEVDGVKARLSYKGTKGSETRQQLVKGLRTATTPWLRGTDGHWDGCMKSDHLLDALICALVARAVAIGAVDRIPPEHREAARQEGWIALPRAGSLSRLPLPLAPL